MDAEPAVGTMLKAWVMPACLLIMPWCTVIVQCQFAGMAGMYLPSLLLCLCVLQGQAHGGGARLLGGCELLR